MRTAIVTGGCGFIGRYVVKQFLDSGYEVYVLVRPESARNVLPEHPMCHCLEFDFAEPDIRSLEGVSPDVFLHFGWGGVNRDGTKDEGLQRQNYEMSVRMLQVCDALRCPVFLDAGSRAECGEDLDDEKPVLQEKSADLQKRLKDLSANCVNNGSRDLPADSADGLTPYGREKRNFYLYAFRFCREHQIKYLHIRLFSVIGVGDHPWSLVSEACRKFKANEEMHFGSCRQLWNYLSVRDVATAVYKLVECVDRIPAEDNRIFNIASRESRELRDYIEEIHRLAGSSSACVFDDSVTGFASAPSVRKLLRYTDWTEQISFGEQIFELLQLERGAAQ